ncbi:hypothetical protein KR044_005115 [Drosophila immigrans]|nr:hypothetical protein KR044_005115 [Drosophila immigrans]
MAYEDQINAFRAWAISLGCPPSALPSDDSLKSVFKSPNKQLFMQLQARIRPKGEVQEVRDNMLIAKMVELKGKVVPACERSFLPREIQIHLRMQDLLKKRDKAKAVMVDDKKECDNIAAIIKTKNIQRTSLKHKSDVLQARQDILELKLEDLNEKYEKEEERKTQILATMPVKLSSANASERLATNAVERALKELGNFYNICHADGHNLHPLAEAKSQLWSQMRDIFGNTPNVLIFNAIMKIKDNQLERIMEMTKQSTANQAGLGHLSKPKLDNFDVTLLKTKADLFGLMAKYVRAKNEVAQLEERFASVYPTFVDELQKKVNNFNGINSAEDDEGSEDIISDFILQYNMSYFYQAQNEFLTEQNEKLRLELVTGAKQLENHEMMIGSIKQMYRESNSSINRIQHDMVQMSQIKDKILYSKNLLKNMLDDMSHNTKSQLLSTKLKSNMSLMGMDSFCLANDSVLSSTRLDIEANTSTTNTTMRRSFDNNTLMPGGFNSTAAMAFGSGSSLPCHLLELNTFAEIPLEKFSCIPSACAFLISANPLIVESQELASTVQLAPGHLLTPYGALQEVKQRILWASAIAALPSDVKLNLKPLIGKLILATLSLALPFHFRRMFSTVDPHDLKLKARRQREEIEQLLDSFKALGAKSRVQLQKINRIFKFALENPLHKYVPPKRTFNGACFADYEAEFNLYYRIATSGGSIKK